MELLVLFKTVPNSCAKRGKRHLLSIVLLVIIMGTMLGYWGDRPLSEFTEAYGDEVRIHLGLSAGLSFSPTRSHSLI